MVIAQSGEAIGQRSDEQGSRTLLGTRALMLLLFAGWLACLSVFLLLGRYNIPAASMSPTLLNGDYIFVSKAAYGLSKYDLPFGDISASAKLGRLWGSVPERGDVVIFKLPKDGRTDYVKRVVGLPGDTIQITNGVLTINGQAVQRTRIEDFTVVDVLNHPSSVPQYVETLPGGVSHRIIEVNGDHGFFDNTNAFIVPADHVFVLGDNRDNSSDSRDLGNVGYVPLDNIVGRAFMRFFSVKADEAGARNPDNGRSVRWERIFTMVH